MLYLSGAALLGLSVFSALLEDEAELSTAAQALLAVILIVAAFLPVRHFSSARAGHYATVPARYGKVLASVGGLLLLLVAVVEMIGDGDVRSAALPAAGAVMVLATLLLQHEAGRGGG